MGADEWDAQSIKDWFISGDIDVPSSRQFEFDYAHQNPEAWLLISDTELGMPIMDALQFMLVDFELRHLPGKHNQKSHGDDAKATGVGASAKVTINGKQYGVGDNITVNGKPHHIADITSDKVVVRPGNAPAKPVAKTDKSKPVVSAKVASKKDSLSDTTSIDTPAQAKQYISRQQLPEPKGYAKQALKDYTDRDYSSINGALRSGKDAGQSEFDIQKHMRTSKLKEPVTVSRAIDSGMFRGDPTKYVGTTIQDKAYLSTSLIKGGPQAGKKWWAAKDTVMHIDVPAGTKAVYMEPLSTVKGEHELLIDKGAKLKINEVTKEGGKWRIKAELLP